MTTPDEILSDHGAEVRALANRLRTLLCHLVPEFEERAYPGWHAIGLRHPDAGYVCGVFPRKTTVRLVFEHGVQIEDPHGLLTGDGSQTRHLELAPDRPFPGAEIGDYLDQALQL